MSVGPRKTFCERSNGPRSCRGGLRVADGAGRFGVWIRIVTGQQGLAGLRRAPDDAKRGPNFELSELRVIAKHPQARARLEPGISEFPLDTHRL
jgi:hypothetical protein